MPQRIGGDGEGIGNAVTAIVIAELCHRVQRSQGSVLLPVVYGIGAGGEGSAGLAAIGGSPRILAVHNVGGNGQHRQGMNGIPIGRRLAKLGNDPMSHIGGNEIHTVVIIAEFGECAHGFKIRDEAILVENGTNRRIANGRKRIRHHGKTGDTKGHEAIHLGVVKGHLGLFVGILIVHVVNGVHGVDVKVAEPCNVYVKASHDLVEIQPIPLHNGHLRANVHLTGGIVASVQSDEKKLGQVAPRPEELHLLTHLHSRHTASNGVIIAVNGTHDIVVLILDRVGINGNLGAEALKALGKVNRPQHRQIGLGRGAKGVEGVKHTEAGLGDQCATVLAHTAHDLGDPHGVAAEKLVVLGSTEVTSDTKLHDKVIHQLLSPLLGEDAPLHITLNVDIKEGTDTAKGHGGAILLLDCAQIGKIRPLDRLAGIGGRTADIKAVHGGHFLQITQERDLLVQLLGETNVSCVAHLVGQKALVLLLLLNETVYAVESHTAVVTDDTASAIGIGEARNDVALSGGSHLIGVSAEHTVVMGGTVTELLLHLGAEAIPVGSAGLPCHTDTAEGIDSSAQRAIGLHTHDDLVILVNVAGRVAGQ